MSHTWLLLFLLLGYGCRGLPSVEQVGGVAELLSRDKHEDYEACTYSFEHAIRDDPGLVKTHNDWDIMFGNGGDVFAVTMVADDRSRLVDLGPMEWSDLATQKITAPEPHPSPAREPSLPVLAGHVYLVRTVDDDTDATTLLRVETLDPGQRVKFTWRPL